MLLWSCRERKAAASESGVVGDERERERVLVERGRLLLLRLVSSGTRERERCEARCREMGTRWV
jgi:hypothetical protein